MDCANLILGLTNTEWLTILLLLVTTFYAWATFKILKANEAIVNAMQEQTNAQVRPYIVISAAPRIGDSVINLEIKNTGRSPALNLKLNIDKSFYFNGSQSEADDISKLPAFTSTIDSLAPDTQLTFMLGLGSTIFSAQESSDKCPLRFEIKAEYSFNGKSYSEVSIIDLSPLLRTIVPVEPVSDEIKKLRQSFEKVMKSK